MVLKIRLLGIVLKSVQKGWRRLVCAAWLGVSLGGPVGPPSTPNRRIKRLTEVGMRRLVGSFAGPNLEWNRSLRLDEAEDT